jgi:hypothetical protein
MNMRDSRWTQIYWDVNEKTGKLAPYVRFSPEFMAMEAAGFSHGLSIGGFFETEEQAIAWANRLDTFFNAMIEDLRDFETENGQYDLKKTEAFVYPDEED